MSKKRSNSRKKYAKIAKAHELYSLKHPAQPVIKPVKEIKPKVEKKKEIKEEPKKPKSSKKKVIIVSIICVAIIIGLITYKFISDNNNKVNYTFKTNLTGFKANLTSSKKKLEPVSEDIKDSVINSNLNYNQIELSNNDIKETITNEKPFFKYYGEEYIPLVLNKKYTIDYLFFTPIDNQSLTFESDNNCVSINNNVINAESDGESTIYACYGDTKTKLLTVTSTSLLRTRDKEFDESKEFLKCEQFSDEENAIIDKILEYKINKVGYQTRAGAVEALRFITLDFPYRINYFNENGRLPDIDGQGRYYHKGLYLSSGKYNDLLDPKDDNKGTWGCSIYSIPLEAKQRNGLDCSSLLGWALYNAGYDPQDYKGADLLMELGDVYTPKEIVDTGKAKVGDFVHNDEGDSHIGMIVGIDDEENYYVAQAIWYKPIGVGITKYTKKQMENHWLQITLMDDYYKEDGNLTNMWY